MNKVLQEELLAMRAEDERVRQELVDSGELGSSYVPRMEAVHIKNAERLKTIIHEHGWPDEQIAGQDGAEAAWLIVQHAIGHPELQRKCLILMQSSANGGRTPRWHVAYLEDRIAMYEGRPQRFGTQWLDDPFDGQTRPWELVSSAQVNQWRAEAGLGHLHSIPERGPELPAEQQQAIRQNQRWWKDWLVSKGWR